MRLSMIVNPFSGRNLQLAAQVGVEDIVIPYPGTDLASLLETKRMVESFGMRLTHVERKLPHLKNVHNLPGREQEMETIKKLVRNMGEAGMELLCYNWMPNEDWHRTTAEATERGGSKVTAFDITQISGKNPTDADGRPEKVTSAEELWDNLERFLNELVPTCEDAGIKLALHPDDPPLPILQGQPRIITNHAAYEKVVQLVDSPANGICYCTGSLGPTGEDLVMGIQRLAPYIVFAHIRNIRGTAEKFTETWHDNGDLDLHAIMCALRGIGFSGALRPDHAPSMAGETNETPGYEMLGRLFAAGYLRALM
jgi:mannonate dehydratase